jgi:hypothetical protein
MGIIHTSSMAAPCISENERVAREIKFGPVLEVDLPTRCRLPAYWRMRGSQDDVLFWVTC